MFSKGVTGDQENEKKHWFPQKYTIHKELIFLCILYHFFLVENNKAKLFLIIFEKEQSFPLIVFILFFFILFFIFFYYSSNSHQSYLNIFQYNLERKKNTKDHITLYYWSN